MKLKEILEKQGGKKLLMQYWKSGALFTAFCEFLLLGKSRTALEILRLSATFKTKKKLEKKYRRILNDFEKNYNNKLPHECSNKVWICWFQGMEKAPLIVKKCFQSVQKNMPDKEIVLITSENMMNYIQFPPFIIDKWKNGEITHTHMTDLLRLELLIRYGGIWMDATVFCSSRNIPSYMTASELFLFQCLKPGRDGQSNYISSWFINSKSNNKILMATRTLLYSYWKENDNVWDYFLLHDFMSIVLDKYPKEWKKIIPRDNAAPHILLLRLFDEYDNNMWDAIKQQTPFHKLSYKFEETQINTENTYYSKLFKG